MLDLDKLIFLDLETTGAKSAEDRITEIGLVEVSNGEVSHWSTLVNPGIPIPEFIQGLTGIDDEMVSGAPSFASFRDALFARLNGRLLIAHNARFDHGFLRNAFAENGLDLECELLCTVKLSRHLFPDEPKHNLDSITVRHQLQVESRHRALADADLLWQFWRKLQQQFSPDALQQAADSLVWRTPTLPQA
jgi:DNA polymerase-3 subunit epsilon